MWLLKFIAYTLLCALLGYLFGFVGLGAALVAVFVYYVWDGYRRAPSRKGTWPIHADILTPAGIEHERLLAGKDIDEIVALENADPATGRLYVLRFYEEGKLTQRLVSRHVWEEMKQRLDEAR